MNLYRKSLLIIVAVALMLSLSTLAHAQGPADVSAATPATAAEPLPDTAATDIDGGGRQ